MVNCCLTKFEEKHRDKYLELSKQFFASSAVSHSIKEDNFVSTFEEIMHGNIFVDAFAIESDCDMIGYMLVMKSYSNEAGGMQAVIDEFFVEESARGGGIGSKILQQILCFYKDYKRIRLEITETNAGAQKLYEKFGFKILEYKQMCLDK